MAEILNCVFCNNSDNEVILFSEVMLKKCKRVLRLRKEHNLKYKDVVLPNREYEGGYHKYCQHLFTPLMKKYLRHKYTTNVNSVEKNMLNDTVDLCSETSSVHELSTQSIEPQCSSPVRSTTLTPKPMKLLVPVIKLERIELNQVKPSTLRANSEPSENIDLSSKINLKSNYKINTCIYCNRNSKMHRQNKQPLRATEKDQFLLKIKQGHENYPEFYDKIVNHPGSKIYYHNICRSRFCLRTPLVGIKIFGIAPWHHIRRYHLKAFVKTSSFILKNVVRKERCYFLSYIFKIFMDFLKKKSGENPENIIGFLSMQYLGDKILKELHADVKIFVVRHKKILAPKKLETINDELFEKLKDQNRLLVKQFQFYQGNYQQENSDDDEAENSEDVDD